MDSEQTSPLKRIPTETGAHHLPVHEDHDDHVHLPKKMVAVKNAEKYNSKPPKGRTIILCLDGTGDKFDDDNSNIVHLVAALKKDDKSQVSYYQAGIGTYGEGGLSSGFASAADMAVGSGLGVHVRDAYHFLMHTYKESDKICIFGFSRGAYTARCLAGMVHKVGLLPPRNIAQIPFAYEMYKDDTMKGWDKSAEFKKTFCIDAAVYFLGLFDSVSSVGFFPRTLPLSSTPTSKSHYFRHAMALDEHRAKFKCLRYQGKDWRDVEEGHRNDQSGTSAATASGADATNGAVNGLTKRHKTKYQDTDDHQYDSLDDDDYERETGHVRPYNTDVLEVWFLGAHADVGGGAVRNEERHKLSNIPLRWMVRQCFECNTGIIFKTKALTEMGLDVHSLWPKYRKLGVPDLKPSSAMMEQYERGLPDKALRAAKLVPTEPGNKRSGLFRVEMSDDDKAQTSGEWLPEQIEDYFDAMAVCNDQLVVAKFWWILEIWPVEYKEQKADSEDWEAKTGMNLGRYRAVEDKEPKLHWTVRHLIHNKDYKLQARMGRKAVWKVVD